MLATQYDTGSAAWEPQTPYDMAKGLAKWCNDASTICATVANHFGRGKAPPRDTVERMILARKQAKVRAIEAEPVPVVPDDTDERVAALFTAPVRQRDYIVIEQEVVEPVNPFLQSHRRSRAVIEWVARRFETNVDELLGRKRLKRLTGPRSLIYRTLSDWGLSSCEIGRRCNRDHSSVLHGFKMFDIYCKQWPDLLATYGELSALADEARADYAARAIEQDND